MATSRLVIYVLLFFNIQQMHAMSSVYIPHNCGLRETNRDTQTLPTGPPLKPPADLGFNSYNRFTNLSPTIEMNESQIVQD